MIFKHLRRRWSGDDGSVIVEAALVLPFLATFAMGTVEFGFGFRQANIVERGASAGARVVSQMANSRNADFEGIRSVASVLSGINRATIRRITIYNAQADGSMPNPCPGLVPPSTGSSNKCNVYDNAKAQTSSPVSGFGSTCGGTSWDSNWCPSSRTPGTTSVGVFVEVDYTALTKIYQANFTISRRAVYLLEPVSVGSS